MGVLGEEGSVVGGGERAGVVAIPTQGFHDTDAGRHLVRWAFCKDASVIEDGLRRLGDAQLRA